MTYDYDLCIIGAGSGGLSVAAGAAQLGLKTALIEKAEMGGDCLNTGCVPSKALLHAAAVAQGMRSGSAYGIAPVEPKIDFSAVKDHVFDVIKTIEPHDSQERFEELGANVFREHAAFLDEHTVQAGDQKITARYFIVATGSRAFLPPIEGLEADKALTNENLFELRERPDHLLIIGGGPIGMEMAQAHRRLGSEVSVIEMVRVMQHDDAELVDVVRDSLADEGVQFYEETQVLSVRHSEGGVTVTTEKNGIRDNISGSHILVATGRTPNCDALGLDKAGVTFDRGGIDVDARLRTNKKHIFAIGDVAGGEYGGAQFTHVAGYHAGIIIRNIAFKMPAKVDYSALPWVTYTDPELAHVGLSEEKAQAKYGTSKVKTIGWDFDHNDRATAMRETKGQIKVVALKNGRIVGASIVGPHAGELISMWTLAISKKMKLADIAGIIVPYPTLSEVGKRAAGAWFSPKLFSERTKKIVGFLQKLPF